MDSNLAPHSDGHPAAPMLFRLRSSTGFAILTVVMAVFVDQFFYSLIIPVVPNMLRVRTDIPDAQVQLWISILLAFYCAGLLLFSPVFGYMADVWSNRRWPLLLGLVALGASTALFAFARHVYLLALARFLQGASAAIVWSVGLALLIDTMGAAEAAFAMGWATIGISTGLFTGPFVGGVLYHRAGHYTVFIVATFILTIDIVLRLLLIERKDAVKYTNALNDDEQSFSRNPGHNDSNASPSATPVDETSSLLRHKSAVQSASQADVPSHTFMSTTWRLVTSREIMVGLFTLMASYGLQTALEAIQPLYLVDTFGWSSEGAGLVFLALVVPVFAGPKIGAVADKTGIRIPTIIGFAMLAFSFPCFSLITTDTTGHIMLLCILMFMVGLGMTCVMIPQMASVASYSEIKQQENPGAFGPEGATAQSCALINGAFALAGIIGPAAGGALNATKGWMPTNLILGAVAFLSIIPLLFQAERKRITADEQSLE